MAAAPAEAYADVYEELRFIRMAALEWCKIFKVQQPEWLFPPIDKETIKFEVKRSGGANAKVLCTKASYAGGVLWQSLDYARENQLAAEFFRRSLQVTGQPPVSICPFDKERGRANSKSIFDVSHAAAEPVSVNCGKVAATGEVVFWHMHRLRTRGPRLYYIHPSALTNHAVTQCFACMASGRDPGPGGYLYSHEKAVDMQCCVDHPLKL